VTDSILIEIPTEADWDDTFRTVSAAFHDDVDEAASAAERAVYEPERALLARRAGEIVGTAAILTRQLGVPGSVVPAAHVTFVSVVPTARRQGILTLFMRRQFEDIRAAGEPIAVLWASEGRIYQRFGYGLAARKLGLTIEARELSFTVPAGGTGRLREGTPTELRDDLVKIYDEAYALRPGWSERGPRHWDYRLSDLEQWRRGATSLRAVIHEGDQGTDGYALWRVGRNWTDNGPNGEVRILELVTTSPEAYTALWRFLLDVDLTRSVTHWSVAEDEPLTYMVNEPRRMGAKLTDALWVRVLDVAKALAARRYATDISTVIEVTDAQVPANSGRYRLQGSLSSATCESTVDQPELACDIRALGAAYLGGASLVSLAAAGLVRELAPGALYRASAAFGWHHLPHSIEVF
jgi:predicted acetyltransferase